MKELIQFENLQIEIWRRSYQRSLNLRVRPDGRVRVTCGRSVPRRAVEAFVLESRDFITRRQSELEALKRRYPIKQFVSEESFLYFGETWTLDVIWSWTEKVRVKGDGGRFEMLAGVASTPQERSKALNAFYKKQARLHLAERVDRFAREMGVEVAALSVRGQRTRWGSCSSSGHISLNWKLVAAPLWVIDYVVIHELAHIRHLNHSPKFWAVVDTYHPRSQEARQWLREHEPLLARQFQAPEPHDV